ncbi:putative T7SS-secreted protein [Streptomyces sp. NPDC059897]|uniref:putative T7SS-secreted protein n=1 Tax=Streptomyces sp. NPDC059897 TaxID=3346994 RepID=UPI00364C2A27
MATKLGETADPKGLIPGEPAQLFTSAGRLTTATTTVEGIGDQLRSVRVPGWDGQAGDAFWDDFSPQKGKWYRGADSLKNAASALQDYADVLEWGQRQAAQAIDLYDAGDETGAESLLESARRQVEAAGSAAAKRFEAVGGGASDAPKWLYWAAQDAQSQAGQTAFTLWDPNPFEADLRDPRYKGWGANTDQQTAEDRRERGPGVSLGGDSVSAGGSLWSVEAMGRGSALGGDVSGRASFDVLGAEAGAGYGIQDGQAEAQASGKAHLMQGSAEGKYETGVFEASGKVHGLLGADAQVSGSVGKNGAHLGGEAFAGGRLAADGHASVAGVGVGGTAEGWAGAGLEGHVDAGMENGKVLIGADVGAAVGFGGKLGAEVEIDPMKVAKSFGDAADAAGEWSEGAAGAVGSVFG